MARLANVLVVLVISAVLAEDAKEAPQDKGAVAEQRSFDTSAWQGVPFPVETPTQLSDVDEPWQGDDTPQEPPRRRRPGRRRKKRPQYSQPPENEPVVSEIPEHQDGVRYNVESGIQVAFEEEEVRPRQRRPQRLPTNAEGEEERPQRRKNNKRKQRPYIPSIETGPTALAGETYSNKEEDDNYKVAPFIEEINHELRANLEKGEKGIENLPSAEGVPSAAGLETTTESIQFKADREKENDGIIVNDKSYRKPYSQAKKQEAEETAMAGASVDLKALLKQSGGLSLSEVLQQRNVSLSDLLMGKQYAISALKTNGPISLNAFKTLAKDQDSAEVSKTTLNKSSEDDSDKPMRLIPISNRGKPDHDRGNKYYDREGNSRRRLPSVPRRQKIPNNKKEATDSEITETTTVIYEFTSPKTRKPVNDNIIRWQPGEQDLYETTEIPTTTKTLVETYDPSITTTEYPTTTFVTTTRRSGDDNRNRLSLKPRLRLPAVKSIPRRISNPKVKPKNQTENIPESKPTRNDNQEDDQIIAKTTKIPAKAFQINIKDLFGMSDIISAANSTTRPKVKATTTEPPALSTRTTVVNNYKSVTRAPGGTRRTEHKGNKSPSAKEEILEVLTDAREGERLKNILAERNMTLRELVEHRERGSSQVHLADIFQNSSKDANLAEPFLGKSLIVPISKETYPLKALLDVNLHGKPNSKEEISKATTSVPSAYINFAKSSNNDENLGIVTLFSSFAGQPKLLNPVEIKKDSEGSSYFTSVISVKPTDEVYRESRDGFQNSHKRVSEIYSSIPTYIKTDEVVDARVIQEWSKIRQKQTIHPPAHNGLDNKNRHMDRDIDGDGLIVLNDIQGNDGFDIVEAANFGYGDSGDKDYEQEKSFYHRLPIGVRSAIIVSSAIVGTSIVVFLTIFVACKWRQKRRNLLRYDENFSDGRVRSPILNSRKTSKHNCSSRSISPILLNGETIYKAQNSKVNTMDSQTQKEAQDYLWDSLRRPFQ